MSLERLRLKWQGNIKVDIREIWCVYVLDQSDSEYCLKMWFEKSGEAFWNRRSKEVLNQQNNFNIFKGSLCERSR